MTLRLKQTQSILSTKDSVLVLVGSIISNAWFITTIPVLVRVYRQGPEAILPDH